MNVGNICQRNVATVRATEDLCAAAHLMREKHIGYLVVVEPGVEEGALRPVGVLTDRDIVVAVVAQAVDPRTLRVGDVMTRNPRTVLKEDSLEDAVARMQSIGVRRLPVLGETGHLEGILTLDDILREMAEGFRLAAGAIGRQIDKEPSRRP